MARPSSTLPAVGQLTGEHQFQIAVLGIGLDRLARDFDRLVELLGIAIGIDLALVAAECRVAAHVNQFLVGRDCLIGLVLLAIDCAEAFEKDAAVVLFFRSVGAVGMRGELNHVLVDLAPTRQNGRARRAANPRCNPPQVLSGSFLRALRMVANASSYLPWRR